mmetsp:Transcript_29672/g.70028  ORF Transcript_29672/g.70028 Transcript_29672/m.70028 type:complete len:88 (+) Transcript_29672:437-700(+)
MDVNGTHEHPLWAAIKAAHPIPLGVDGTPDLALMDASHKIWWNPVSRADVAWNFEKVLIAPSGEIISRHNRHTPSGDLAPRVEALLE